VVAEGRPDRLVQLTCRRKRIKIRQALREPPASAA
jgi:hypothetical protein